MTTRTDSELKTYCFNALVGLVGHVDMERFIALMNREPRDYTKWRETQFNEDGKASTNWRKRSGHTRLIAAAVPQWHEPITNRRTANERPNK